MAENIQEKNLFNQIKEITYILNYTFTMYCQLTLLP